MKEKAQTVIEERTSAKLDDLGIVLICGVCKTRITHALKSWPLGTPHCPTCKRDYDSAELRDLKAALRRATESAKGLPVEIRLEFVERLSV